MIHSEDLLTLALTVIGNDFLIKGNGSSGRNPRRFSQALSISLEGEKDHDHLHFQISPDQEVCFTDWLNQMDGSGARFISIPDTQWHPRDESSELEWNEFIAHAFHGGHELILGVLREKKLDLFFPEMAFPPKYLFGAAQIIGFIEDNPHRDDIIKQLLWQNEYNLQFCKNSDWDSFKEEFSDDKVEELMMLWGLCFTGESAADIYGDWDLFAEKFLNPDKRVTYCYRKVGSLDPPPGLDELLVSPQIAIQAFADSLSRIADYSERKGAKFWTLHFRKIRDSLEHGKISMDGFLQVFSDCGLSDTAVGLLSTGVRADVFGGMGSWNDVPFMNELEYGELSSDLLKNLYIGLAAAVNYSFPGATK